MSLKEVIYLKKIITSDEHRAWVAFHQTYELITRCEENVINRVSGTTPQQHLALWLMEYMKEISDDPIIISDLASNMYRSVPSVSAIIDRMEKVNLVKKVRDVPDRRAIRVKITPKGKETFVSSIVPSMELIKRFLSILSEEEIETLLNVMGKLKNKALQELGLSRLKIDPEINYPQEIAKLLIEEKIKK
jgi:DNA-binding MarR family transcriptional regulator